VSAAALAFVQDHLVQRGGAERVLLTMMRAFPDAPLYTSFYRPDATFAEFQDFDIRPAPLNRFGAIRDHHRAALPLFPPLFNRMRVDAEVVVCGTAGWAQGAKVTGRKVVYFHAMAGWLHAPHQFADSSWQERAGLTALRPWLARWDRRTGPSGDRNLVYGRSMQQRVRDVYGIEAEILPPPLAVTTDGPAEPTDGVDPGFILCAARLVPYKNVDAIVEAFTHLPDQRLVVAGAGPELDMLRTRAPANVLFLGDVDDVRLRWLYRNCRAAISAGYEPYGLTPVEAAAFGKPSAALGEGGLADTVAEGDTGVQFATATPRAIADAINRLDTHPWRDDALAALVHRHAPDVFAARLGEIISEEAAR
jgi:glycosyltransferase involved in cell wall biosynthesis